MPGQAGFSGVFHHPSAGWISLVVAQTLGCTVYSAMMNTDDTIYALATPWAESALAVIRTSGPDAISLSCRCFSRPQALEKARSSMLVHGYLVDPATQERVDEVVAAVYREGHGYTGENAVEFTCHGSLPGLRRILDVFAANGFRAAEPGEFTFRAFMHGKLDLTQAEAVQELVAARSAASQSLALSRLGGALGRRIEELKQQVLDIVSFIEVQLDYAEDEIGGDTTFPRSQLEGVVASLEALASTWKTGRLYGQGARVVLAGATNAGKSSLFNLFLKEERAIVSDRHGTTRDFLEAWIQLEGVPVRLYDTAGLRDAGDTLEAEGIRRTEQLLEQADLILLLVDGSQADAEATMLRNASIAEDPRTIVVWNKSDLSCNVPTCGALTVSSRTGEGMDRLVSTLASRLKEGVRSSGDERLVIESDRQRDGLLKAADALRRADELESGGVPLDIVAMELGEALNALGELTGEVTGADILERIFSGFCVGK